MADHERFVKRYLCRAGFLQYPLPRSRSRRGIVDWYGCDPVAGFDLLAQIRYRGDTSVTIEDHEIDELVRRAEALYAMPLVIADPEGRRWRVYRLLDLQEADLHAKAYPEFGIPLARFQPGGDAFKALDGDGGCFLPPGPGPDQRT